MPCSTSVSIVSVSRSTSQFARDILDIVTKSGVATLLTGAIIGASLALSQLLSLVVAILFLTEGPSARALDLYTWCPEIRAVGIDMLAGASIGLLAAIFLIRGVVGLRRHVCLAAWLVFSILRLQWWRVSRGSTAAELLSSLLLGGAFLIVVYMWRRRLPGDRLVWIPAVPLLVSVWLPVYSQALDASMGRVLWISVTLIMFWVVWFELGSRPHFHRLSSRPVWIFGSFLVLILFCASVFGYLWTGRAYVFSGASGGSSVDSPNVLLITLDTLRARNTSVYGYTRSTTPFLEEFSDRADLFVNSYASSDMTLSTHASLFTGLLPSRHGAHTTKTFVSTGWSGIPAQPGRRLGDDRDTIAEILERKGYLTAAVVSNIGYLGGSFGLDQGFQVLDAREPRTRPNLPLYAFTGTTREPLNIYRNAGELNDDLFPLLRRLGSSRRPFFLFLNYMDAHAPYLPPSPYDRLFPGKIDDFGIEDQWALDTRVMAYGEAVTEEERAHLVSQYDGEVAFLDSELRNLFAFLEQSGELENTLVVITSDHGEAFGRRGFLEHSWSVYEELVRVPLIVRWPGQGKGRIHEMPVGSVDVFATIADVARHRVGRNTDGRSLERIRELVEQPVIAESFPSAWYPSNQKLQRTRRAVSTGELKYIASSDGSEELYALRTDPLETNNIMEQYRGTPELSSLREWLRRHLERSSESGPGEAPTLSEEQIRRLKALGYIR